MSARRTSFLLGILLVAGAGTGVFAYQRAHPRLQFATAVAARGDIRSAISATGTLNAVVTVPVGTQVSGTIQQLFADFNSPVRKGQLIARIDPATVRSVYRFDWKTGSDASLHALGKDGAILADSFARAQRHNHAIESLS